MTGICISAMLLSLTAGMFLLAKTNKDNLSAFFKVISWAVIVISMLGIVCCSICCVMGRCHQDNGCNDGRQECGSNEGCEEGMPGMHKRMMIMKMKHGYNMEQCKEMQGCEEGQMECEGGEGMSEDCCKGEKMDCCKMKAGKDAACIDKVEIKKDTVIVKKK